jgi:hypothetical protein
MTFSKRHGFASTPEVRFRYGAPENLRYAIIQIANDVLSYSQIRAVVCRVIHEAPNPGNWSEVPNIRDEVQQLISSADWFYVYDIIEENLRIIEASRGYDAAVEYAKKINDAFVGTGAGWQLKAGEGIVIRGDAEFEDAVQQARDSLGNAGFSVAQNELREALRDISRRPEPDLTGAIHHSLGALEAAARYVNGSEKGFGDIVDQIGIPKPLDIALSKMWGYSSNFGRHVSPTNVPSLNDATLVVHLASAFCRYLVENQK